MARSIVVGLKPLATFRGSPICQVVGRSTKRRVNARQPYSQSEILLYKVLYLHLQFGDATRERRLSRDRLSFATRGVASQLPDLLAYDLQAMERGPAEAGLTRNRRYRYAHRNTLVLWILTASGS